MTNWIAGDIYNDNIINIFDLIMMKQLLLSEKNSESTENPPVQTNIYEPEDFEFSGKVFTVGDSTVCDYDTNTQTTLNRYGWGMKLAEQFSSNVIVTNLALSGRSSRSFLNDQNYSTLTNTIGKGDYLFIQFGHNDEKTDEATYPGLGTYPNLDMSTLDNSGKNLEGKYSYEWMILNKYIKLAQSKGAVPVIVTPITRRGSDGTANYQQHTEYQQALIELGKQNNVALIDMTKLTTELYTNLYNSGGATETAKMHCYIDTDKTTIDNTHLSNAGAQKIANMIAEQTKELGLTIGNEVK